MNADLAVALWDASSGTRVHTFERPTSLSESLFGRSERDGLGGYAVSADSRLVAVAYGLFISIFDLTDRRVVKTLETTEPGWHLRFTPDGRNIGVLTETGVDLYDISGVGPSRSAPPAL